MYWRVPQYLGARNAIANQRACKVANNFTVRGGHSPASTNISNVTGTVRSSWWAAFFTGNKQWLELSLWRHVGEKKRLVAARWITCHLDHGNRNGLAGLSDKVGLQLCFARDAASGEEEVLEKT